MPMMIMMGRILIVMTVGRKPWLLVMMMLRTNLMTIPMWGRKIAKSTQMTMVVALMPRICHSPLGQKLINHSFDC